MVRGDVLFGKNLGILRNKKGISQQELADAIHVTRQTISLWERGGGKPDIYYLEDICNYFNVSLEQMMHEKVIGDVCETIDNDLDYGYDASAFSIKGVCKKGLYSFIDEDLENFFDIIRYEFAHIMVVALELKREGYLITEVFDNGFSIYLRSDEEAMKFPDVLYGILDCFIHHDNAYMEEKLKEITEPLSKVSCELIRAVSKEIYGRDIYEYKFYWVDEMENLRGYADTEDECKEQAEMQECRKFYVLPRA